MGARRDECWFTCSRSTAIEFVAEDGDHHGGRPVAALAQLSDQRHTVPVGEAEVGEEHVRNVRVERPSCVGARPDRRDQAELGMRVDHLREAAGTGAGSCVPLVRRLPIAPRRTIAPHITRKMSSTRV